MKEQRDRVDREHQEELDHYLRTTKDLKAKIDELQRQTDEKQVMLNFISELVCIILPTSTNITHIGKRM